MWPFGSTTANRCAATRTCDSIWPLLLSMPTPMPATYRRPSTVTCVLMLYDADTRPLRSAYDFATVSTFAAFASAFACTFVMSSACALSASTRARVHYRRAARVLQNVPLVFKFETEAGDIGLGTGQISRKG